MLYAVQEHAEMGVGHLRTFWVCKLHFLDARPALELCLILDELAKKTRNNFLRLGNECHINCPLGKIIVQKNKLL